MNCNECENKLTEVLLEKKDSEAVELLHCKQCDKYYALGEFDSTLLKETINEKGEKHD